MRVSGRSRRAGVGLPASDFRFQTSDFRPLTSDLAPDHRPYSAPSDLWSLTLKSWTRGPK